MFHVSTLLPRLAKDQQQLERKRHIGNDRVCIVFQDEYTLFTPETIKSKLLHVFVVIQPVKLADGAKGYQVSVISKNDVPIIEPLIPKPHVFKKNEDLKRFLLTKLINAEYASLKAKAFKKFKIETIGASLSKLYAQLKKLTFEFTGEDFSTCGNLESELKRAMNRWPSTDNVPPSPVLSGATPSPLGSVFLLHSPKQQLLIIQHLQQLYAQQHLTTSPEGDSMIQDQNLSASQHNSSSFSNKMMKRYALKPFQYLFNSSSNSKSPQPIGASTTTALLNDSSATLLDTSMSNQAGKPVLTATSSKPVTRTQSTNAYDESHPDPHNSSTVSNPDTLLSKIKHLKPEFHAKSRPAVTTGQLTPEMLSSLKTQAANMLPAHLHLASPQIPFIHSQTPSANSGQQGSTPVSRGPQRKTLRDYVKKYIATSGSSNILPSYFPDTSSAINKAKSSENNKEAPYPPGVSKSGIIKFNSSDNLNSILKDSTPKSQKRQAPLAPAYSLSHLSSNTNTNLANHSVVGSGLSRSNECSKWSRNLLFQGRGSSDGRKVSERHSTWRQTAGTKIERRIQYCKQFKRDCWESETRWLKFKFLKVSPKTKKDKPESFASRLPFASFKNGRGKSLKTPKPTNSTPSSPYIGKGRLSHDTALQAEKPELLTVQDASRYRCNSLDSTDDSNLSAKEAKKGKAKPQGPPKTSVKTSTGKRFSLMHLI